MYKIFSLFFGLKLNIAVNKYNVRLLSIKASGIDKILISSGLGVLIDIQILFKN